MMKRFFDYILTVFVLCVAFLLPATSDAKGNSRARQSTETVASKKKVTNSKKGGKSRRKGTDTTTKKSASSKSTQKKSTSADLKRQQAEAQKDIAKTKEEIKLNEAEVKKNLGELGRIEGDIADTKKKVADANTKVESLRSQISLLETKITGEEEKLESMRSEYLKVVKKMQTKRRDKSAIAFIFSSKSFNQAMRRLRYLRQFSDWRKRQSAEITNRVNSLKEKRQQLAGAKVACDKALAENVRARNELQNQYAQQDAVVVQLRKNGKALQSHLEKKQAEVNALKNRVASLIAEEQRKAEAERRAREQAEARRQEAEAKKKREAELLAQNEVKESETKSTKQVAKSESKTVTSKKEEPKKAGTAPANASASGFAAMRGSLPHPVSGYFRVTSRFGRNSLPNMPEVTYDNPGIDAECTLGGTAQAVYAGKVSGIYKVPGYETVVIVNHDDYYTVYGNIIAASVKVGDTVKQGQAVGKVGADENNPKQGMIHFEVWKKRDKTDPLSWLR